MTDPAAASDRRGRPPSGRREPDEQAARAQWEASAAAVLRKVGRLADDAPDADAWARLTRTTVEGLAIPLLGTAAAADALPTAGALAAPPGHAPYLRGSLPVGGWDVRTLIDIPDPEAANRAALADLTGGGNSLWIRVGAAGLPVGGLAQALDDVHLDLAPVVLDGADDDILAAADALGALVADRGAPLHAEGSLGADPLGWALRRGTRTADLGRVPDAAARATGLGVGALVVDGTAAHGHGAGDAQEIGYTLAVGAAYLRALAAAGYDVDTACSLIGFRYAVTDEQFVSLAKLRAARVAWNRLTELCGASRPARAQYQHAVTSRAMMTRYDRYVNMLRGTVAAFAAAAGGARAITVLPFDTVGGERGEFGRRMARNVSVLLGGESDVDAVADPAGGAYAVEALTATLAEAAWAEFDRIEAAGGIGAALADGSLMARLGATETERDRRIARRTQPITGVSEFPLATDAPAAPADVDVDGRRWAEPFEALRDTPAPAPLALVRLGTPARSSSRFAFAENLLIAGGVPLHSISGPEQADADSDLTGVLRETGCPAVVFAGADADYAALLPGAVAAARAAGIGAVFVAGRPPAVSADGLVDGTVAAGDDVLAFLATVRAALGAPADDPAATDVPTKGGAQ